MTITPAGPSNLPSGAAVALKHDVARLMAEVNELLVDMGLSDEVLNRAQAGAWHACGEEAFDVAQWIALGVREPGKRPPGLTIEDCWEIDDQRAHPAVPNWRENAAHLAQWAGVGRCCSRTVEALLNASDTGHGVVALASALTNHTSHMHEAERAGTCYARSGACPAVEFAERVAIAGVDWADVATCVRAGLGVDEAIEHVQAGRDMGPVRVMAGLV